MGKSIARTQALIESLPSQDLSGIPVLCTSGSLTAPTGLGFARSMDLVCSIHWNDSFISKNTIKGNSVKKILAFLRGRAGCRLGSSRESTASEPIFAKTGMRPGDAKR